MKDLFALFCVRFSKRNSDVRKRGFLKWFIEVCEKAGFHTKLDETKERGKKSRNLVVGSVKNADTIIITGYDTGNKILLPGYKYYPFNLKKDQRNEVYSLILQMVLSIMLIAVFFFVVQHFMDQNIWLKILIVLGGAAIVFLIILLSKGMANKYNFNKNTAALTIATALVQEFGKAKDKSVAFIFADNVSASFFGYIQLAEKYKIELRNKKVLILDCVMSNGEVYAAYTNQSKDTAKLLHEIHPGINMLDFKDGVEGVFNWLPQAVVLTSGSKTNDLEIAISGTRSRHDCAPDFNRLDAIYEITRDFINKK
ncbi:MAG: hypothetical protein RR524_05665 [Erysipelotrichaceae bacterium]